MSARYVDVVLHRRVPKGLEFFTYIIPLGMEVKVGEGVHVPFRNQIIPALVWSIHQRRPSYNVRDIVKKAGFCLERWQMELALWMMSRYGSSASTTLDFFVPEKRWKYEDFMRRHGEKVADLKKDEGNKKIVHKIITTKTQKNLIKNSKTPISIKKFIQSNVLKVGPHLIIEKSPMERGLFYKTVESLLPAEKQLLILVPEIFYAEHQAEEYITYHSGLREVRKALIHEAVATSQVKTILATRMGLFLPFKNLGAIILDYEHAESYREQRSPAYHALEVAQEMAALLNIPLIVVSATPRVETFYLAQTSTTPYTVHTWEDDESESREVELCDMVNERRGGNRGLFAQTTLQKIASALQKNEQVLLFAHNKGEASALFCTDCGAVVRCEKCKTIKRPYREGILACHQCGIKEAAPLICPACGNTRLKNIGFGTMKVDLEIQNVFGKAHTLRFDGDTLAALKTAPRKEIEKSLQDADIIIATSAIEKPLNLPRLSLVVAVLPDGLLQFPHFRASERLFQILTHLKNLTKPGGKLIIQTYSIEQPLYKRIAENNAEAFYGDELITRKLLGFPPF